jgi:hypothetical protein
MVDFTSGSVRYDLLSAHRWIWRSNTGNSTSLAAGKYRLFYMPTTFNDFVDYSRVDQKIITAASTASAAGHGLLTSPSFLPILVTDRSLSAGLALIFLRGIDWLFWHWRFFLLFYTFRSSISVSVKLPFYCLDF